MTAVNLVVLSLAVYRVARFVGWDSITQRFRERFTGWSDDQKRNGWPHNRRKIAEMIHCPFCFSLHVSVLAYVAWVIYPEQTMWVATPLAIAAVAGLIGKNLDA